MKNIFTKENLKNFITNQFVVFFVILFLFFAVNLYFTKSFFPSPDTENLWFYSGVFMVLFSILFIDKYYNSPKNVITNIIPLLLVFLSIKEGFQNQILWHIIFWLFFVLLIFSILPLFQNEKEGPASLWNKVLEWIKNIVSYIGQGKIIYSVVFLIFLYLKFSAKSFEIEYLVWLIIWGFVLLIDPKKLNNVFSFKKQILNEDALGEIIGVQSKKMFLVRLFEKRKSIRKTDLVKFKYSMEEKTEKDNFVSGLVFDTYLLNQEKWMKVLQLEREIKNDNFQDFEKNIVYKVSNKEEKQNLKKKLNIDKFIGVVAEGSNIGKIKFEYLERDNFIEDGDLLELKIGEKVIFYQVTNAETVVDKLEFKNETGYIQSEAIQLGEWVPNKLSFQKYGWVPSVNTPVFLADTDKLEVKEFEYPEYKLGVIPKTKLPSVINLNDAVSHHMALLGVTGSGKSHLARKIINELNNNGTKVICVDFNNEFVKELSPSPESIISEEKSKNIFNNINKLNTELSKFANQQNQTTISEYKINIYNNFKLEIENFLNSKDKKIKIFELPEISTNRNSLDYTRYFFDTLFKIVRDKYKEEYKQISIVLEEAHTVIPEWNFSGSSDKTSQALVNNIGQIVLQGRKYGIGFLVIAQRTANVSKTVLTQCNTVICFQAFDDTSISFLGNYIGRDLIEVLPNLKPRHAIVVGKASKSNMPMIVDLNDENLSNQN